MKKQSVESQKGEIDFRKKLVQQQVEGKCIFDDEFDTEGIEEILGYRMERTFEQMTLLREKGAVLSPYVEIGAERCQRSLVMENDLDASGAAVDISYEVLKSCDYYSEAFNKSRVPLRICCDANSLPFMTDSIPFVFCYQTLHHFPDPTPIAEEIHRILSPGGYFFFDEEPYKKTLHLNLYKKKICPTGTCNAGKIREFLDYYFSEMTCNEVEHGITENFSISVDVWKKALSSFEERRVKLQSVIRLIGSVKPVASELFNPENYVKYMLAYLFGGEISGTCRKAGTGVAGGVGVRDLLICPSCIENKRESKLLEEQSSFFCQECGSRFPIVDGVVFLLSCGRFRELYPGVFETIQETLI